MPTPVKLPAEVENIIHHADGVKSFIMRPMMKCPNFKPGQFLHLAIDEYDPSFHWPESRVFSIANSPTRRDKLRITFSVQGKYTRRMYEGVKEGDILWLKLPYGSFFFPDDGTEIVLIAGGTGITPFVSFLEYAIDNKINSKIKLYYGVRSTEYLIFDSLLEECERKLNAFDYRVYMERDHSKSKSNQINTGIIPIQSVINKNQHNKTTLYYLSGPQQMILTFREELMGNDIPENNIIIDKWE